MSVREAVPGLGAIGVGFLVILMGVTVRSDWYVTHTWAALARMGKWAAGTLDDTAKDFRRISMAFTGFGILLILLGCISVAANLLG